MGRKADCSPDERRIIKKYLEKVVCLIEKLLQKLVPQKIC